MGFFYTWEDGLDLTAGATYYYWLDDVDIHGIVTRHGPISVVYEVPTAVRLTGLTAGSADAPTRLWQQVFIGMAALLVFLVAGLVLLLGTPYPAQQKN